MKGIVTTSLVDRQWSLKPSVERPKSLSDDTIRRMIQVIQKTMRVVEISKYVLIIFPDEVGFWFWH